MTTYISILRGINVSGHNMIKMEALRKLYASLGLVDVQSYIQSGNLIFRAKESDNRKLEAKIVKAIKNEFGFDVPVMIIGLDELKKIAMGNPFADDKQRDTKFMHVSFLSGDPGKPAIANIDPSQYHPDEFSWKGRSVYLYCPGGYGNTKLNNSFFEKKLKLTATTRNWKTVNELIRMAEDISK
ncbi:MAG TPA: DUF1697 domain-containing protein [Chitinophagaceae bacterium]|nr:DUF1697 domain-containing protein [Chitinophagaceae bacterium]